MSVIVVAETNIECSGQLLVTPVAEAAMVTTEHLIKLGHRNIAVVGDDLDCSHLNEQLEGYRLALKNNGIQYNESLVPRSTENKIIGSDIAQILERNSDMHVTAVFAMSSAAAVSVLSELRLMGKNVGVHMSVVCYDNLEKGAAAFANVTTVSFSSKEIASHILQMVMHPDTATKPSASMLRPKLTVRLSSVACPAVTK